LGREKPIGEGGKRKNYSKKQKMKEKIKNDVGF